MALTVRSSDKKTLEWSYLDDKTKEISNKISDLANGLTPSQFCEAIEFALHNLSKTSTITTLPVRRKDAQD